MWYVLHSSPMINTPKSGFLLPQLNSFPMRPLTGCAGSVVSARVEIPVGNWLQVTVLGKMTRRNRILLCSTGPCKGLKEEPQRPANPSTHTPYSSDFYNLMPRSFVCRKQALGRKNELAEARVEVPELGFSCSSGLTLACYVASNSPPWDRGKWKFPSHPQCLVKTS